MEWDFPLVGGLPPFPSSRENPEICKRNYTKESINNQKVQKFVSVLDGNSRVKNAPKLSAKNLEDKRCKIKQIKNISVT